MGVSYNAAVICIDKSFYLLEFFLFYLLFVRRFDKFDRLVGEKNLYSVNKEKAHCDFPQQPFLSEVHLSDLFFQDTLKCAGNIFDFFLRHAQPRGEVEPIRAYTIACRVSLRGQLRLFAVFVCRER